MIDCFIKSEYFYIIFAIIGLVLVTFLLWKKIWFIKEKKERFEVEYHDVARDVFCNDEEKKISFMKGIDYVILGKPKKAMPILKKLLQEAETVNERYAVKFFMTECYHIMEQYQSEITLCQDMIHMDAERVHAWFQMGSAYFMLDQYQEAIEALKRAESLMHENVMADNIYAFLASVYVCTEDFVEAEKYIDMAYQLNHNKDILSLKASIEETLASPIKKVDGVEVTPVFLRMVEMMGYPCRAFPGKGMSMEETMEIYHQLVRNGKDRGFVPVILWDDVLSYRTEIWKDMADLSYDQYIKNKINAVKSLDDGKEIADRKFRELTQSDEGYETYEFKDLLGDFAGGKKLDCFEFLKLNPYSHLFEVPVQNPWEVLLSIPNLIWEEYVDTDEVIAICKYWYEKYRALPAVISSYGIEFAVPEPVPESEAFEVAKEIYAFCDETVTMNTKSGTLGELADSIRQSTVWALWWD